MKVKLTNDQYVSSASAKLAAVAVAGLIAGLVAGVTNSWAAAPLVAWDVAALLYMITTWGRVLGFGPDLVKLHALRDDPSRWTADLVIVGASIASLVAVVVVLAGAAGKVGADLFLQAGFGLASV